jgi:hypothetical protein
MCDMLSGAELRMAVIGFFICISIYIWMEREVCVGICMKYKHFLARSSERAKKQ